MNLRKLLQRKDKNIVPALVRDFEKMEHFPTIEDAGVSPGGSFKAQFDLVITRATANIAQPLPVAILGFSQLASGYNGIVLPVTAGTVTVEYGTNIGLPDRVNFTHDDGVNQDVISVTCPQTPYPQFLFSSAVDRYRINNIRYSISNDTIQSQFSQQFKFKDSSIFGLEKSNGLTPITFKNPMNEQDGIIDIPVKENMDKEKCILLNIHNTAAFSVTLSFFVEYYDKFTAKDM